MTDFVNEISSRIASARENVRLAHEADEPYLADVHLGELESLARLAAEHGVAVAGLTETLAQYGVATPSAGLGMIDLGPAREDAAPSHDSRS